MTGNPETTSGQDWDMHFKSGMGLEDRTLPSALARKAFEYINTGDFVLDLGCGIGTDANLFAEKAGHVDAVDPARQQIEKNQVVFRRPNLNFDVADIEEGLPQEDGRYNLIYARQSLHYTSDPESAFSEVRRLLTSTGWVIFEVKSDKDRLSGQVPKAGDVRHFYSQDEVRGLLPGFEIRFDEDEKEVPDYFGYPSRFLRCIARKGQGQGFVRASSRL